MAISVSNNAGAGRITSVGNNNGGQQGGANPQQVYSKPIQGSSPNLQPTYNPQVVATFNQQVPRNLVGKVTNADVAYNQQGIDSSQAWMQQFLKNMMQPPKPAAAANYDIAGANARARAAAEASQNPLYTKYLNDFLENARTKQAQEVQKADMANKELDRALKYTTEDTAKNRMRTSEDVTLATDQINTAEDQFQTDTGTQDAIARIEEARKIATSGQTGGLAGQQKEASQEARNTSEKRQGAAFDEKKMEQQVLKARTFEDLGKVDTRAKEDNTAGKKKVKFDLDAYITDYGVGKDINSSGYQVKQFADKNEQNRLASIADEQANQSRLLFNNFVAGLNDPGVIAATRQKYGGGY